MLVPFQKAPTQMGRMKPQEQDSPLAQFGRYGLYRTLARLQDPRAEVDDPVSSALMHQAVAPQPRATIGRGFRR